MNKKQFALSPLAAAILLSTGSISAQTITSAAPGEVINVAPNQIVDGMGDPGVLINQPDVELINEGEILSEMTAVDVVTGGDNALIDNIGIIDGSFNGVRFGADVDGGEVLNSGLVISDSRAVDIQGDNITVNNVGDGNATGVIETSGPARNGVVYTNVTANNTTINNGDQDTGEVGTIEGELGAAISAELAGGPDGSVLN